MSHHNITKFLQVLEQSIEQHHFIKLSLSNYQGKHSQIKKFLFKPVLIKNEHHIQQVSRFTTKDITTNISYEAFLALIKQELGHMFHGAHLETVGESIQLNFINKEKTRLKRTQNEDQKSSPITDHDKKKNRLITPTRPYLMELGISSTQGNVLNKSQDKYRQINRYIEIIVPHFNALTLDKIRVADMGSGKGYLTFALYDYLRHTIKRNIQIDGIELRRELVDNCNALAKQLAYDQLNFIHQRIDDYSATADVVIALHACDTATDDAIYKGVQDDSSLIIVAPCCHKQVRRSMADSPCTKKNPITRYGTFLERQAELLTDSIRALILESQGYKVKVMEFISTTHTPKNVLLIAEKTRAVDSKKLTETRSLMESWGIKEHYLMDLLNPKIN